MFGHPTLMSSCCYFSEICNSQSQGTKKSQEFLGLHNFSGADWGTFIRISKKTWDSAYLIMILDKDLSKGFISPELINDELPSTLQSLEHIACHDMFTVQTVQQPCDYSDGNYFCQRTWRVRCYLQLNLCCTATISSVPTTSQCRINHT